MRRPDRAAAQHDLPGGERRAGFAGVDAVLDARGGHAPWRALEEHARHVRSGDDREVRPPLGRRPRGTRDRCSTACRPGWWSGGATRRRPGHRGRVRCSHRAGCRPPRRPPRTRARPRSIGARTETPRGPVVSCAGASIGDVVAGREPLALLEVRQHVAVAPPGGAALRPGVEVARMAPHVGHVVHARRSAEHLAPRHHHPPVRQPESALAGIGGVHPVRLGVLLQRRARRGDQLLGRRPPARLEQRHPAGRILGETSRDHRSGGSGAHHDEIEGLGHVYSLKAACFLIVAIQTSPSVAVSV